MLVPIILGSKRKDKQVLDQIAFLTAQQAEPAPF